MARAFLDTNVIVYALLRDSDPRHVIADRLLGELMLGRTLVLSTQVLQESYSVLTGKKCMPAADALAMIRALADEHIVGTDTGFVLRSLGLAERHRVSVWDALIVQAALDADCAVLYTEDLHAGTRFGTLEVVNPFASAAHDTQADSSAPTPRRESRRPTRRLPTDPRSSKRKKSP